MAFLAPTASEIRAESKVNFAEYGFVIPEVPEVPDAPLLADPITRLIQEALSQILGAYATKGSTFRFQFVPDHPAPIARLTQTLVRMWVEYLAVASQPEIADVSGVFDVLSSTSSGGASDSHREIAPHLEMYHPFPPIDRLMRQIQGIWERDIEPVLQAQDPTNPLLQRGTGIPAISVMDPHNPRPGQNIIDPELRSGLRVLGPWSL